MDAEPTRARAEGVLSVRESPPRLPLALFVRPPEPGRVKTRLTPALGPTHTAAVYAAFIRDVLTTCRSLPRLDTTLWVAGDPRNPTLDAALDALDDGALPSAARLPRRRQPELDLGARMRVALEDAVATAGAGLVVGSDVPTLPASLLDEARRALGLADLVLGPSADGGFYLIGVRDRVPPLFGDVRYGTRHAFADTLALATRAKLTVRVLAPWYDVDTPRDLALLVAHLETSSKSAPATARALEEARHRHNVSLATSVRGC